jgi:23S rRNA (guanine2445-N2)-methyltransferase / 23S rRNA (guanine2069-N7)-methyltransferase
LRKEGRLYFSTNRRGFTLDVSLQEEFLCEDITAQTLPPDFQRNRKIHCCWSIRHK